MKKFYVLGVSVIFIAFSNHPVFATSFDCAKASMAIEHMICSNHDLSELDDKLASIFSADRSTLPSAEVSKVVAKQKVWLKSRSDDCAIQNKSNMTANNVASDCLKDKYNKQIEVLKKIKIPSQYGVLHYHLVDMEPDDSSVYISELFNDLIKIKGPLKDSLHCNYNIHENCDQINPPTQSNTVSLEYGRSGWFGFGERLRSFVTDTDGGSGHFTLPVMALEFDYTVERRLPDHLSVTSVIVSLTGMQKMTNADRLPHVKGLPKSDSCFGCE